MGHTPLRNNHTAPKSDTKWLCGNRWEEGLSTVKAKLLCGEGQFSFHYSGWGKVNLHANDRANSLLACPWNRTTNIGCYCKERFIYDVTSDLKDGFWLSGVAILVAGAVTQWSKATKSKMKEPSLIISISISFTRGGSRYCLPHPHTCTQSDVKHNWGYLLRCHQPLGADGKTDPAEGSTGSLTMATDIVTSTWQRTQRIWRDARKSPLSGKLLSYTGKDKNLQRPSL